MADEWRDVVAVVVAPESPIGRAAGAVDDMAAHLPPPGVPMVCPLCPQQSWPCAGFDDAARRVLAAGLRLPDLVPLDLHPRLWFPPPPKPPAQPDSPPTDPPDDP